MGTEPSEWAKTTAANIAGTITEHTHKNTKGIALAFALALDSAQRAASVRVVKIICDNEMVGGDGTFWLNKQLKLEPGQSLAIIERPAEAAAGEGAKP